MGMDGTGSHTHFGDRKLYHFIPTSLRAYLVEQLKTQVTVALVELIV